MNIYLNHLGTSNWARICATASDYSSLPSWSSTFLEHNSSAVAGNFMTGIPNANLSKIYAQNVE